MMGILKEVRLRAMLAVGRGRVYGRVCHLGEAVPRLSG